MTHALTVMPIALAACAATLIGGLLAVNFRDRLHLVLGFSAGAVIAVAFFDLLPEALETGRPFYSAVAILTTTAIGFFIYVLLDRIVLLHDHEAHSEQHGHGGAAGRGFLGAGSFSAHSFLDGFAIGIAFQASRAVGIVVAVAVLVHDFSDGLNTVNVVLKNGGDRRGALRWLAIDAVAPIAGAAVSLLVAFPQSMLAQVLALFGGFFLYIGASDLLPESHHAHPRFFTTFATLLGAASLYAVTRVAA
jgi:ZIP family zinc transporter